MENYKLIKADLDRLRTLVEKSELWVEKKSSGGGDGKKDKKDKKDKKEKGEVRRSSSTFFREAAGLESRRGGRWRRCRGEGGGGGEEVGGGGDADVEEM